MGEMFILGTRMSALSTHQPHTCPQKKAKGADSWCFLKLDCAQHWNQVTLPFPTLGKLGYASSTRKLSHALNLVLCHCLPRIIRRIRKYMKILCWLMKNTFALLLASQYSVGHGIERGVRSKQFIQEGGLIEWSWLDPLESKV